MPARAYNSRLLNAAPAFALPVLYLGYAVVANYEFVSGLGRDIAEMPKSASAYLNGEAAVQIDSYYKKIMPHRLPSIDAMGAARYLVFREGRPGVVVGNDGWLFSKEEFEAPLKRSAASWRAAREKRLRSTSSCWRIGSWMCPPPIDAPAAAQARVPSLPSSTARRMRR